MCLTITKLETYSGCCVIVLLPCNHLTKNAPNFNRSENGKFDLPRSSAPPFCPPPPLNRSILRFATPSSPPPPGPNIENLPTPLNMIMLS